MLIFALYEIFELADIQQDELVIVLLVAALLAVLIQHGIQGRSDIPCRLGQAVAQKLKPL